MNFTPPVALIIPASAAESAAACFAILDQDTGGAGTFDIALQLKGGTEVTHWGTYTPLAPATHAALRDMTATELLSYVNALKPGQTTTDASFVDSLLMGEPGDDFWAVVDANGLEAWGTG